MNSEEIIKEADFINDKYAKRIERLTKDITKDINMALEKHGTSYWIPREDGHGSTNGADGCLLLRAVEQNMSLSFSMAFILSNLK